MTKINEQAKLTKSLIEVLGLPTELKQPYYHSRLMRLDNNVWLITYVWDTRIIVHKVAANWDLVTKFDKNGVVALDANNDIVDPKAILTGRVERNCLMQMNNNFHVVPTPPFFKKLPTHNK